MATSYFYKESSVLWDSRTGVTWRDGFYLHLGYTGALNVLSSDQKVYKTIASFQNVPQGTWKMDVNNNGVLYLRDSTDYLRAGQACATFMDPTSSQVNRSREDVSSHPIMVLS